MSDKRVITIFHSPDADDAFMFYGMVAGAVNHSKFEFAHDLCDIESLNHRALKGELDVTAVSVHAFAYLKNRYAIMRSGASMGGKDYGPMLVAKKPFDLQDGKSRTFAIPRELTSAALAFRMYLKEQGINAELVNIHFDKVLGSIADDSVDAGIIIHEGQITHKREGFATVLDLGQWWWQDTGLPLPLGINIVKKDIGAEAMQAVGQALKDSIEYSLSHRKQAIEYALTYGRGITFAEADRFIDMYVNERTRDIGAPGIESITKFLKRGAEHGIIPGQIDLQFV